MSGQRQVASMYSCQEHLEFERGTIADLRDKVLEQATRATDEEEAEELFSLATHLSGQASALEMAIGIVGVWAAGDVAEVRLVEPLLH